MLLASKMPEMSLVTNGSEETKQSLIVIWTSVWHSEAWQGGINSAHRWREVNRYGLGERWVPSLSTSRLSSANSPDVLHFV